MIVPFPRIGPTAPLQNQTLEGEDAMSYWKRGGVCHIRVGKIATACSSMNGTASVDRKNCNCLPCFRAAKEFGIKKRKGFEFKK